MAAVQDLNNSLKGSPYSLSDNESGTKRADFLIEEMKSISQRHEQVERNFAAEIPAVRMRLEHLTRARSVFESNALELTGLPLSETEKAINQAPRDLDKLAQYLVEKAVTADRQLIDVLGLHRANLFVSELATEYRTSVPISEIDVRTLHAATVPTERFAGEYRKIEVAIAGSGHVPPSVLDVPRQMYELVNWLNTTQAPPPLAATVVHSWLTIIHPFQDGNGRVARLLANLVLLRSGWPTLIIRSTDRIQYIDALAASDEAGDLLPLFDLFIKSMKRSLKEISKPGLAERLYEEDLRAHPDLRYQIWSGQIHEFLEQLRIVVARHGFDLFRLSVPSASTFVLLNERDSSGNTWLAKIRHQDGRDFLLWLGFMSHEMSDYGGPETPAPSIFISERNRGTDSIHPYTNPLVNGSPIPINEISLVPTARDKSCFVRTASFNVERLTIVDAVNELGSELVSKIY